MNGLDPIVATTLATRIDSVLNAVSGSTGAAAQTSGAQQATPSTVPATGANPAAPATSGQPTSTETTLSNTALALDAILRLDTSLLSSNSAQPQTTLLSTPPAQAGSLAANLAAEANLADAASSGATAGSAAGSAAGNAAGNAANLSDLTALLNDGTSPNPAGATPPAGGGTATTATTTGGTAAAASLATLSAVNSGDPLVNALATALQQAVGNSGLFYESHLVQWLSGERTSDSLQSEPQAQLNNPAQAAGQANAAGVNDKLSTSLANLLNPGGTTTAGANPAGTVTTSATAAMLAAAKTTSDQAALPIHPDSIVLVRQQLDLLATSQFQWNGQAWPGAPMSWEIAQRSKDGSGGSASDPADGQVWHTRITLELPVLGKVEAQLSLNAKQLTARITTNAQSASTMASGSIDFRRRTAAAGLDLLSLQIRQSGAPEDAELQEAATAVDSSAGGA